MSDMQKQECLQPALACLAYLMQLHPIQHNSHTHPAHTSSLINYEKTAAQHPNSYNPETTSMETESWMLFCGSHARSYISMFLQAWTGIAWPSWHSLHLAMINGAPYVSNWRSKL
jgi:hypothetical protein